jgi:hypothetical protein
MWSIAVRSLVQPTQVVLYEGQIRVQQLQLFKRCLGLLYSAGQGQPGNGIAQAGQFRLSIQDRSPASIASA